jgi:hypothetical protein
MSNTFGRNGVDKHIHAAVEITAMETIARRYKAGDPKATRFIPCRYRIDLIPLPVIVLPV